MNVAIIGFGLIGQQRARAVASLGHRVVAVYDPDSARAEKLSAELGYRVEKSTDSLLQDADIDIVIVAVPHKYTRALAIEALSSGKHVFCEKPLGRNADECRDILQAAQKFGTVLGAGFNYRYYPGIREAYRRVQSGAIGELTHMRCIIGHGGRPGMESEWKTSKEMCGGGALLDPGIHILDLVRHLAGPIRSSNANLARSFWNIDVEDNAFVTLEAGERCVAQCHISITEWKSTFSIDAFGTEGSVHVHGRGGFYGQQRFQYHKRWAWMEKTEPEPEILYSNDEVSFRGELEAYIATIQGGVSPELGTGDEGLAALEVITDLYDRSSIVGLETGVAAFR